MYRIGTVYWMTIQKRYCSVLCFYSWYRTVVFLYQLFTVYQKLHQYGTIQNSVSYTLPNIGRRYLSIHGSMEMDRYPHITPYWTCDYLPMLGLKLIRVSKRRPRWRGSTSLNLLQIGNAVVLDRSSLFWHEMLILSVSNENLGISACAPVISHTRPYVLVPGCFEQNSYGFALGLGLSHMTLYDFFSCCMDLWMCQTPFVQVMVLYRLCIYSGGESGIMKFWPLT